MLPKYIGKLDSFQKDPMSGHLYIGILKYN